MVDRYRFLDPWTLMLPERGSPVIAIVGSGGKTTLLLRLLRYYRQRGLRVLAAGVGEAESARDVEGVGRGYVGEPAAELRERLARHGVLFVGPAAGEPAPVDPLPAASIETLRTALAPDVTLVEAHTPTGTPLRADGVVPVWPSPCHLAFLVAQVGAVGRPWGPSAIVGVTAPERRPSEEPRRVAIDDVVHMFTGPQGLVAQTPAGVRPIPFLTGLGGLRDIDGMFQAVSTLWELPGVRLVCLAELVGEERRDQADLRGLDPASPAASALSGPRIYALYPAELDDPQP